MRFPKGARGPVMQTRLPSLQRAFAKAEQLFLVVPSVHQMERSPLGRRQRTQNRMVEQLDMAAEAGLTPSR